MGSSTLLIEVTALQRITGDSSAATLVALKQALNDANKILNESYDWPWLEVRSATNLVPAYSTGTITLTAGATSLTSSGATWSAAWSPVRIRSAAGHDYLASESAGTWTIERNAVVTETGVTYVLYKDTYALLARLRALYMGWGTVTTGYPADMISEAEMQVMRSGPFFASTPVTKIALVEPDSTNLVSQMMVFPVPSTDASVHWRGYREVADLTEDGDTFQFPGHVLPVFRRLARSLAFEAKGSLDRAADERNKYEVDLARLRDRADNTASAQDAVILAPSHFKPKPPTSEYGYGYDTYW